VERTDTLVPVESISRAYRLVRSGYADWVLFKRGDVWGEDFEPDLGNEEYNWRLRWYKDGYSLEESMVISSYGANTARPKWNRGSLSIRGHNVIVSDLHAGFIGGGSGSINTLIEGCAMSGPESYGTASGSNGIELRRNAIYENYYEHNDGHSQGIYTNHGSNYYFEENIFDSNGWWNPEANPGGYIDYDSEHIYSKYDFVKYHSHLYIAVENDPQTTPNPNTSPAPNYNSDDAPYSLGDFVQYEGVAYEATVDNVETHPTTEDGWLKHGWIRTGYPTMFNHNIYLGSNTSDVRLYRNIVSRASSYGVQMGGGGKARENIFAHNRFHLGLGGRHDIDQYHLSGIEANVDNNILLGGGRTPDEQRSGRGIQVSNTNPNLSNTISNNIVFNPDNYIATNNGGGALGTYNDGYYPIGQPNLTITGNIIYNHPRSLLLTEYDENISVKNNVFQQPFELNSLTYLVKGGTSIDKYDFSGNTWYAYDDTHHWFQGFNYEGSSYHRYDRWLELSGETDSKWEEVDFVDTNRSLATYNASLGGEASFEAFITEAREQSCHNWNWDYSAVKIRDYFKEGFTIIPHSLNLTGPDKIEAPATGQKKLEYEHDVRCKEDKTIPNADVVLVLTEEYPGLSIEGNNILSINKGAAGGETKLKAFVYGFEEVYDELTVSIKEAEKATALRRFITPSNRKIEFGPRAKEVLITDVRGREVARISGEPIIFDADSDVRGNLESGLYIYKVITKDGKTEYGTIAVAR